MARAVGLDIGSRTIKVVEVGGNAKAFKVLRAIVRDVPDAAPEVPEGEAPPEPEVVLSDIVRDIFEEFNLPRDDVCTAFSSAETQFREIQVPFSEDDQIRKVVRFEAENHLHSQAIEDVIINWLKTGHSKDGSRLTVFASPKENVARTIGIVRAAGIESSSMDLDATAIFTAYDATGVFRQHPNALMIDVGARSTTIMLVASGRPLTMRSFRLGADHVTTRAALELDVAPEEARRRVALPSGPRPDDLLVPASAFDRGGTEAEKSLAQIQDEALVDQRGEFVRKLHRESIRSLASLHADAAPDRILISGGGSLLPGLPEALEEKFGLPVERIDLSKRVEWRETVGDPARIQAVTPAAVGCALRILGYDPLGVELLQDEFAPTNRFDVLKNALAVGVTLLFLVLLGLSWVAMQKRNAEQLRHRFVVGLATSLYRTAEKAYLTKVESQTEPAAATEIENRLRNAPAEDARGPWLRGELLRRYNKLQSELGLRRDIPPVQSALKVWLEVIRALSTRSREDYGYLRILKMDIKPRTATIRIEVDEQKVFDWIRQQFEESAYFKERARTSRVVEQGATQFVNGHWQQDFDFRFKEED